MIKSTKIKFLRVVSIVLGILILSEILFPTVAYALTSGPSQPEVQSFAPIGTTEMVDVFTGDFNYNIPLFELPGPNGGYPFNVHYNSGISMDKESSWTGLGWNLNPGAITRDVRGLPDEYNGDLVKHEEDMKPNVTFGVGVGADIELFGADFEAGKAKASLSLGLSIYYNNYKGVGYSTDAGITASTNKGVQSGITGGIGLDIKMDSQEGVGVSASLSLTDEGKNNDNRFNVGTGYNSRVGMTHLTMGLTASSKNRIPKLVNKVLQGKQRGSASIGGNSTLSVFSGGYSPSLSMPMTGHNIHVQFKGGGQLFSVFGNGMVNGYYNTQKLKNKGKIISTPSYGYFNLDKASDDNAVMDFNREKDGMVRKNSPNIAIPSLTFDIYSVAGQGTGGMFRAFRNDVGVVRDPITSSESSGGALGIETGGGNVLEVGADISVNSSTTTAGAWKSGNANDYGFKSSLANDPTYEPYVLKSYGELTTDDITELDFIGGTEAMRGRLNSLDLKSELVSHNNTTINSSGYESNLFKGREPRNLVVSQHKGDIKKGLSVTNPDGTRYVYSKVANNTKHIECNFACGPRTGECDNIINIDIKDGKAKHDYNNTNEYFKRTEMPEYAHSYMLEYVLGSDYLDIDADGVPSDADFGYWVRFYYTTVNNYNWRVPFAGANYMKGLYTTFEDDKGSYMYGSKQVLYLKTAETKTHIAYFNTSVRRDGYGVAYENQSDLTKGELQNDNSLGAPSLKLDNIKLFSKADLSKPIKSVYFEYNYELCKGIYNNDGLATDRNGSSISEDYRYNSPFLNQRGKLTLKKLWFTYENNERGQLSPYVFNYSENGAALNDPENPNYNPVAYDRWGNYKPFGDDYLECDRYFKAMEFPYVRQFNKDNPSSTLTRENANRDVAVWSLKEIKLPSGALVNVEYESDDYAYVQNKVATQMFEIASLSSGLGSDGHINHDRDASGSARRIYFNLEIPIEQNASLAVKNYQMAKYIQGIDKVYYRVFMKIRKISDEREDFVSGYAYLDDCKVDESSIQNGFYKRGYVELGNPTQGKRNGSHKVIPYHPFSVSAWQYIRTDQPQLAGVGPFDTDPNANESAAMDKVKSLASAIPEIKRIFKGFNRNANSSDWGEDIFLDKSFIRLNSPDKSKIGGGLRVKKITIKDRWNIATKEGAVEKEAESTYGQVYEYTMKEYGETISSGVASYEPMIGGDENPLRNAKEYPEFISMKTDNNLFFELPVNESYYPGASVGYRKVTIKSLATEYEQKTGNIYGIPSNIITTGAIVHEFYTSKEFPVITFETDMDEGHEDYFIPIPLIGEINSHKLTATQGYSIILNDMHGKPRKVSNFKQDIDGNILYGSPESYVEYLYSSNRIKQDSDGNHDYFELQNNLPVLVSDNGNAVIETRTIGQDYEFFADSRYMNVSSENGGLKINTEAMLLGIIPTPFAVPWPSFGTSTTEVKLFVTNKIIHRFGIPSGIVAFDGGSIIKTNNELFDNLTGQPVLTSVTNDFDDPIYDYNYPAHLAYDKMGPAYKNIGLKFNGSLIPINGSAGAPLYALFGVGTSITQNFVPGDEFYIPNNANGFYVTFVKKEFGNYYFSNPTEASVLVKEFTLVRSGRRNILSVEAGNIKALGQKGSNLGNPTKNRH